MYIIHFGVMSEANRRFASRTGYLLPQRPDCNKQSIQMETADVAPTSGTYMLCNVFFFFFLKNKIFIVSGFSFVFVKKINHILTSIDCHITEWR